MTRNSFIARQSQPITNFCGPMQAWAVLAAHGVAVADFRELYPNALERFADSFMPWDMSRALNRRGLPAKLEIWSRKDFIANAIKTLQAGHEVVFMLRSPRTDCLHWASLWGFDEASRTFAAYDSQYGTVEGMNGNTRYSVETVEKGLRWKLSPFPYTFAVVVG